MKKKRSFLLKLLVLSLALIAVMGWLRAYQSLYQWETLLFFGVRPGPWYSLISGVFIGLIATSAALSAWLQLTWSRMYVQISIAILVVGWWLDYLIFSQNNINFYNLPFRIAVTVVYGGFVFGYFYFAKYKTTKRMKNEKYQ